MLSSFSLILTCALKVYKALRGVGMESIVRAAFSRAFEQQEAIEERIEREYGIKPHQARIVVVGVGGAGCNTVTRLSEMGVKGAEIIALNTDAKHLAITKADKKLLIGKETTKGLGAGGYPEVGEKAARESQQEIKQLLQGADLVFVTCGLGGGTGTGGAPVVAEIAKSLGAIVIGAVTMPFKMEGARIHKAEDGLFKLRQVCDTVVVIENQKLLEYAGQLPLQQAFAVADELIATMIKGITEAITVPSHVNIDFADLKAIMSTGGVSAICVGESDSQEKVKDAVLKALNHPLLEVDYSGAKGALVHVTCGYDCTLAEINDAVQLIADRLSPEAQVIWGVRVTEEFNGKVQVIAIITGVKSPYILGPIEELKKAKEGEEVSLKRLGIEVI